MNILDGRISFDNGVSIALDKDGVWIHGRPRSGENRTTFIEWNDIPELASTLFYLMAQRENRR